MLPFLKNRQEGSMSGPVESVQREPDEDKPMDMLDAVAEDIITAIGKKDKALLKDALAALVSHIQEADEAQDSMEPAV